jgi:hypothetical protein
VLILLSIIDLHLLIIYIHVRCLFLFLFSKPINVGYKKITKGGRIGGGWVLLDPQLDNYIYYNKRL